jgi:antagonist of KipI
VCTAEVLGSRSTYVRGGVGGVSGRALRKDDVLAFGPPSPLSRRISSDLSARYVARRVHVAAWGASTALVPRYSPAPSVRLLVGEHMHMLTPASRELLFRTEFRVGAQSDRMGYRLEGASLEVSESKELLSEGVAFGTVQLPPGGKPIILMADRQTTGGYPRIGEVASVDLPLVAQLRPGHRIRFRPISLSEAHALYLVREADFAQAKTAIALRYKLA